MSKKLFKFENFKPLIVLTSICLVVAALLAGVNMVAAPIIEARRLQGVQSSLLEVMPDGEFNEEADKLRDNVPETVKEVYTEKNGKGYVVVLLTNKGYTGKNIGLTVGIDNEGKILNVAITQNEESIVPSNMKPGGNYGEAYKGATADTLNEVVTGATVKFTEGAIKNAIGDALVYLDFKEEETLPTPEDEIIIRAEVLLGAEMGSLTNVTPEGTTNVKRVYKDESGKNYAVYTVVISQYGTPETEAVVHITNTGVIKGVRKVTWKVSDPAPDWGYNPPSEERVDQLFNDFKDKTAETIDDVDLNTGATNTATNLLNAMKEALSVVKGLVMLDMPTPEEDVLGFAEELLGAEAGSLINVTPEETTNIKRIYKDKSGKNYAVYTVVISQYGTPETEAVVHITNTGIIKGVKKITWKVSDAKPEWGYNPPSDERVDQLFSDFVDKNSETIDEVDIKTGATNTGENLLNAFKESIKVVKDLAMRDMPTAEEEIIAFAETLLGAEKGTLTNVPCSGSDYIRRVYRTNDGKDYVVYAVVISQYGTPETETLVHIDENGTVAGIHKITWKVSDAKPEWGYNPPSDERVDQLYIDLLHKNAESIDEVDLKTGATNTGKNLILAIKDAFDIVEDIIESEKEPAEESRLPRIIGVLILAFGVGAAVAYTSTKAIIRRKRK